MNTTDEQDTTELTNVNGELLPIVPALKNIRAQPCEYDEKYISAYIENPHLGKSAAYKKATGDTTSYSRQRAYVLHQRLAKQIDERLKERVLGCIGFGMNTLFELAQNSESDSVRAGCASKLVELGMRVQPPEMQKPETRSREQILLEIEQTKQRINDMQIGTKV